MSVFGKYLQVSLFGASHEKYIGLTIHNYPSGIKLSLERIYHKLALRRGLNSLTSKRLEMDEFEIISGYFNGFTTGAPITVLIKNSDVKSADYEKIQGIARPSHADYTYHLKYNGFNDYRGGGTSSGRLSVALIVLGAICEEILETKNILIATRVKQIKDITDNQNEIDLTTLKELKEEAFPVVDRVIKDKMLELIAQTKEDKDSLGAIVETYIENIPAGLGEPFFDSFESILSHLIFSIPGIKGIEFGTGFDFANMNGSRSNDGLEIKDGNVNYLSNHNGGINGGITNGNTVIFKTVFKPTSSIGKPQQTINFLKGENEILEIGGRHDTIFAIKGVHVVNAVTAYAVLELLIGMGLWKN